MNIPTIAFVSAMLFTLFGMGLAVFTDPKPSGRVIVAVLVNMLVAFMMDLMVVAKLAGTFTLADVGILVFINSVIALVVFWLCFRLINLTSRAFLAVIGLIGLVFYPVVVAVETRLFL